MLSRWLPACIAIMCARSTLYFLREARKRRRAKVAAHLDSRSLVDGRWWRNPWVRTQTPSSDRGQRDAGTNRCDERFRVADQCSDRLAPVAHGARDRWQCAGAMPSIRPLRELVAWDWLSPRFRVVEFYKHNLRKPQLPPTKCAKTLDHAAELAK